MHLEGREDMRPADFNALGVVTLPRVSPGFIWVYYNVGPPSDVSWFRFAPVTIVISTINHSEIGVINQLSYRLGAPHCSNFTMIYGSYNELVTGDFNLTYN